MKEKLINFIKSKDAVYVGVVLAFFLFFVLSDCAEVLN